MKVVGDFNVTQENTVYMTSKPWWRRDHFSFGYSQRWDGDYDKAVAKLNNIVYIDINKQEDLIYDGRRSSQSCLKVIEVDSNKAEEKASYRFQKKSILELISWILMSLHGTKIDNAIQKLKSGTTFSSALQCKGLDYRKEVCGWMKHNCMLLTNSFSW